LSVFVSAQVSSRVNCGGIHQHDWDVVLNGVHAAAFAAFQASTVRIQDHRNLANRADEYVEQILGNHSPYIVARVREHEVSSACIQPRQEQTSLAPRFSAGYEGKMGEVPEGRPTTHRAVFAMR